MLAVAIVPVAVLPVASGWDCALLDAPATVLAVAFSVIVVVAAAAAAATADDDVSVDDATALLPLCRWAARAGV